MTTAAVHTDTVEPPELAARNLAVGARLWAAAQCFFFVAFLFAFFYLRALDSNGVWRGWPHHHPHASRAFGIAIVVCVLASAGVAWLGTRTPASWRLAGLVSLLLGLTAIALQAAQFSSLGFGPTDGGYASVFVGWTGLFAAFALGAMYWLTTLLTGSRRAREPGVLHAAAARAFSFVWTTLAAIELAAFVLLYFVA